MYRSYCPSLPKPEDVGDLLVTITWGVAGETPFISDCGFASRESVFAYVVKSSEFLICYTTDDCIVMASWIEPSGDKFEIRIYKKH